MTKVEDLFRANTIPLLSGEVIHEIAQLHYVKGNTTPSRICLVRNVIVQSAYSCDFSNIPQYIIAMVLKRVHLQLSYGTLKFYGE